MNSKTTLGIMISIGLIAGLASAHYGGAPAAPLGDPPKSDAPKPKPSASTAPKAPKPEPKKPDDGGW